MGLFDGLFKKPAILIGAPVEGQCVSIKEVNDPTFSEEILGKGVAIRPMNGRIVSPIDGVISTIFPTGHAVGITGDSGVEILVHIGLDTVSLKGEHFVKHAEDGQSVKAGDLLIEADIEKIKEAGYDVITPIVICNSADYSVVEPMPVEDVKVLDNILKLTK